MRLRQVLQSSLLVLLVFITYQPAFSMVNPLPMLEVMLFPIEIESRFTPDSIEKKHNCCSGFETAFSDNKRSDLTSKDMRAVRLGRAHSRGPVFYQGTPKDISERKVSIRLLGRLLKPKDIPDYADRMGSVTGNN